MPDSGKRLTRKTVFAKSSVLMLTIWAYGWRYAGCDRWGPPSNTVDSDVAGSRLQKPISLKETMLNLHGTYRLACVTFLVLSFPFRHLLRRRKRRQEFAFGRCPVFFGTLGSDSQALSGNALQFMPRLPMTRKLNSAVILLLVAAHTQVRVANQDLT